MTKSCLLSTPLFHHVIVGDGYPPATLQHILISLPIIYGPSDVDRVPFKFSVITGLSGGTMTLKLISDYVMKPML